VDHQKQQREFKQRYQQQKGWNCCGDKPTFLFSSLRD
jgi:hypothetical protein